jgi:hypothetical protein
MRSNIPGRTEGGKERLEKDSGELGLGVTRSVSRLDARIVNWHRQRREFALPRGHRL